MTVRINWTEAAQARRPADDDIGEDGNGEDEEGTAASVAANPITSTTIGEDEEVINLEDNRCDKIWEGPLRDRAFKAFKARNCPTDTMAKEALGVKWIGQWDLAKAFIPEEEL